MANYLPNVWADLQNALIAVWPEIGINFRPLTVEKINWTNVIESGQVSMPYAVINVPPNQEAEDGPMGSIVFEPVITLYYITQDGIDTAAGLEAKMKAMLDYLTNPATLFQAIQYRPGSTVIDVTPQNTVNISMLEAAMPFSVGALSFRVWFGESLV